MTRSSWTPTPGPTTRSSPPRWPQPRRPARAARSAWPPGPHASRLTRTTFSGLRILGPNIGWQNPEIGGTNGALPQCTVTLNCGTGTSSWLVGTATTYDVTVSGICFKSSNGATQFYHHPYSAGTSYATRLDTLTFYGFKHVLGTPGRPLLGDAQHVGRRLDPGRRAGHPVLAARLRQLASPRRR